MGVRGSKGILLLLLVVCLFFSAQWITRRLNENKVLSQMIDRLEADSRVAEVLVTDVRFDERTRKLLTTIKFLEYDVQGQALSPRYFTFSGNLIQFQSLVIRFADMHVRSGSKLRGKSAYLFWKVFVLNGLNTQEYAITEIKEIPKGYRVNEVDGKGNNFERQLWLKFWEYALDAKKAKRVGVRSAQIEAPGTMFVPGMLYTIKIEHDGGMRIDVQRLPQILYGEKI